MKSTKKTIVALGGASLAALAFAATVAAAGPHGVGAAQGQPQAQGGPASAVQSAGGGDIAPTVLGLTQAEVRAQRQAGLSLAQIAQKQAVDPTRLIEAFAARWSARIDGRVSAGALTAAEATALKDQLTVRARDMVYRTTLGGMRGVAVGAGPNVDGTQRAGNGRGRGANGAGMGAGNGVCPGTGAGAAQP